MSALYSLEELKAKGRLVLHGGHRPILVVYDHGVPSRSTIVARTWAFRSNGAVEDGILTCHWHHARFDLESSCTFDLGADDVPPGTGVSGLRTAWHTTLGSSSQRPVHGQLAAEASFAKRV